MFYPTLRPGDGNFLFSFSPVTDSYLIPNSASHPHPSWMRNSHFLPGALQSPLLQIQVQSSPVHSGWGSSVACRHLEPSPSDLCS